MTSTNPAPVCTISQTGIFKPSLQDCIDYFDAGYLSIYGSDVSLDSSTQDGEWLGLQAAALDDANSMCVDAYQSYSPATAQGAGLSSNVKINGLAREIPTFSTAPVLIVGVFGTPIPAGIVEDQNNNQWSLPASIQIPMSGQITVEATCLTAGAIAAPVGTINQIKTQTRGWQSVSNTANAVPGAPVQSDAALRQEQALSTMLPASGPLAAVVSSIAGIPNIGRIAAYENDLNVPDSNNIPGHSIAIVCDGGDPVAIATAMSISKQGGTGTFGTTTESIVDQFGVSHPISFFFTSEPTATWGLTITPKNGFSLNTVALIQASLAAWTNSLGIGVSIQLTRAYSACYLQTSIQAAAAQLQADLANNADASVIAADSAALTQLTQASLTYEVNIGSLTVALNGGSLTAADAPILFNQAASAVASGVTVTVA